jgi:16S rRNA (adenine1518-N6/adenine1519-N6)-dimethyltransferase
MSDLEKLKEQGFRFQKRFGQNFITDTNLLRAVVRDAGVTGEDFVVEVGAGAGTLTREISDAAKAVTAFEIDRNLSPVLDALAAEKGNVTVVYGDILRADIKTVTDAKPFKLVANLPYYITTPVMFHFLKEENLRSLTVMVQKEVAERFTAKAGTAAYGAVTAQLAAYGMPTVTRVVPRTLFTPQPNVDSAIVHMAIEKKQGVKDFAVLQKLIAASFAMRRKTLVNNLTAGFAKSRDEVSGLLAAAGIDPGVRGETLTIEDFIRLANILAGN